MRVTRTHTPVHTIYYERHVLTLVVLWPQWEVFTFRGYCICKISLKTFNFIHSQATCLLLAYLGFLCLSVCVSMFLCWHCTEITVWLLLSDRQWMAFYLLSTMMGLFCLCPSQWGDILDSLRLAVINCNVDNWGLVRMSRPCHQVRILVNNWVSYSIHRYWISLCKGKSNRHWICYRIDVSNGSSLVRSIGEIFQLWGQLETKVMPFYTQ